MTQGGGGGGGRGVSNSDNICIGSDHFGCSKL